MRTIGNGRIRRTGAGISYGSGASIKQLADWELATDDDAATVEASGYFDDLAAVMKVGEVIKARLDLNGSPRLKNYLVATNSGSAVTVLAEGEETSGSGARAVVPTSDGLTTGLIRSTDRMVVATSAGANNILTLPTASAATRGKEIWIWVAPSTNCELRTPDASGQTINGVDSDGTQEALLTHSQLYVVRQHLDTGWLLQAFTALGAVATAIVPD